MAYQRVIRDKSGKVLSADEVQAQEITRIRMPKGRQTLGFVERRVGGSRMIVRCFDGKERNCRIPGRLKRSLWVREGDIVIVEPWEYSGDEKGDIILKYTKTQVGFLRRKGYLNQIEEAEEF